MLLKFEKQGLQKLHFFTANLNFPVAVASYSEWETTQIEYLIQSYNSIRFTTESLCQWCINHQIKFQIVYPLSNVTILKHPFKYFKFLQLKKRLRYSL